MEGDSDCAEGDSVSPSVAVASILLPPTEGMIAIEDVRISANFCLEFMIERKSDYEARQVVGWVDR